MSDTSSISGFSTKIFILKMQARLRCKSAKCAVRAVIPVLQSSVPAAIMEIPPPKVVTGNQNHEDPGTGKKVKNKTNSLPRRKIPERHNLHYTMYLIST
jgi:hypothetical protein